MNGLVNTPQTWNAAAGGDINEKQFHYSNFIDLSGIGV